MSHIIRSKRHSFEKKKRGQFRYLIQNLHQIESKHTNNKHHTKNQFKNLKKQNQQQYIFRNYLQTQYKKMYNINSTTVNNNYNMNKNNRLNLSARNHELVEYHAITKPHCMYVSKVTEILKISF